MITKNYVQLQNIQKIYDDGYIAVQGINISIDKGEFVTLLGPSGCGKTTILKMLAGFDNPTNGQILVNGIDIKELPINQRPTATVFQDYALFPNMTVYQNIVYGLKIMRIPLKDVPENTKTNTDYVYERSVVRANKEIKQIKIKQNRLLRQIVKYDEQYRAYQEVENIKLMRHVQFQLKQDYFLKKIKQYHGEDATIHFSAINKRKEFQYLFKRRIWKTKNFIKYNLSGLNKWEKLFFELRKWYLWKLPLDVKYDKLTMMYNELDKLSSYWQNFPEMSLEKYQKHNTSRKLTKEEIAKRAKDIIQLVGLEGNERKYPAELSGGMQQRVALARALVVEPQILLLDEPLSALDAKVRKQMQTELKRLHNELGITFILVTHDQEEALTLSNKIVVMSKGRVEQIDSPKRIYDNPRNEWVANFIGKANLFSAEYVGKSKILFEGEYFNVVESIDKRFKPHTWIKFMIRPEDIYFCEKNKGIINAKIVESTYKGQMYSVSLKWKQHTILVESTKQVSQNTVVGLDWDIKNIHVMLDKVKRNPNEFRF